jgi:hypothetical protein
VISAAFACETSIIQQNKKNFVIMRYSLAGNRLEIVRRLAD